MNYRGTPRRAALIWIGFLAAFCYAGVGPIRGDEAARKSDPALAAAIDAALDVDGLRVGFQGIVIQSAASGEVLYERNPDRVFLPASNTKLLTASIALHALGPDFVYRTRFYRTGSISKDGELQGDLVLKGVGDPLLASSDLDAMALEVVKAGIRRVTGGVRYDDSLFDRQALGDVWAWDDEPFYYSAQISALNLDKNLVTVRVTPGAKVGDRARVTIQPTQNYTLLLNTAATGPPKSKRDLNVTRMRGRNILVISGSVPIDVAEANNLPIEVTVEDPARFASVTLDERLRKAGVVIQERALPGTVPAEAVVAAEHVSIPLSMLLQRLNKPSDNLIAECLLKTVGAAKTGKGTSETGIQAAREWFAQIGMDMKSILQADGSGLSRVNYVSPRNFVRLLSYWRTRKEFGVFYDSLPIAGVDGTLRRRMKGTPAENNCRAKTGYVSHVSSLSGYVTTRDGEALIFSILMNNHLAFNSTCMAAQDKIVALLAGYTRKK